MNTIAFFCFFGCVIKSLLLYSATLGEILDTLGLFEGKILIYHLYGSRILRRCSRYNRHSRICRRRRHQDSQYT